MEQTDPHDKNHVRQLVKNFKTLYQSLNKTNIHNGLINKVYDNDIEFIDSFHKLNGMDDLTQYLSSVYENVIYSRFEFHDEMVDSNHAMLTWTMNYAHPKLNGGKNIMVQGCSHIRYSDKVYFHQDYIDGGELLYQHIPILSWVIKKLKSRMV